MGATDLEIWRHATNIIQRANYGVAGKRHYDLQKERTENMAQGGCGGTPGNEIMTDVTDHEGSIREMHFNDWLDGDFQRVLDIILEWEKTDKLPTKPSAPVLTPAEQAVERAYDIFQTLDRDDQVDALNALAEKLGVMAEDEEDLE